MLIDHNNEETLPLVLETGCWAGHSIYPEHQDGRAAHGRAGQDSTARERIIVNSAADWGISDPLKVPKTVAVDARAGHPRGRRSRPIVWDEPGRVLRPERAARRSTTREQPDVDQRELFEGNSVLRGQSRASSQLTRRAPHRRPRRRRADAGICSASTRRTSRRFARAARMRAARTVTAGRHLLGAGDASSPARCRASTASSATAGTSATSPRCWFWRQSNQLVGGEKVWEAARAPRSRLHLREAVLVVQHVQQRRRGRSRRARCTPPTAASCPTSTPTPPSSATSCSAKLGDVPAVQLLGPARRHQRRRSGSPTAPRHVYDTRQADADARLPAAPRLRPAAPRARTIRASPRTCARSTPSAAS